MRKYIGIILLILLVVTVILIVGISQNMNIDQWMSLIQTSIILVELPVIIFGFWQLRNELEKREKKPIVDIGLYPRNFSYDEIRKDTVFPKTIRLDKSSGSSDYQRKVKFVLFNKGNLSAKYIKIKLIQRNIPERVTIDHYFQPLERNPNDVYNYESGSDLILYANDLWIFSIVLRRDVREGSILNAGKYKFDCEIYMDGLESCYSQDLTIEI